MCRAFLLCLERSLQVGGVALGNVQLGQRAAYVGRDLGHVPAAASVAVDHHPALGSFPLDLVGAIRFDDFGQRTQRQESGRRRNQEVVQAGGRAILVRKSQHDIEPAIAVHDLRHPASVREGVGRLRHGRGRDAVQRGACMVTLHPHLRNEYLLLDLKID